MEQRDFYKVYRVNMRTHDISQEPLPQSWERLGGRALLARILLDEVPPTCEPLGPFNKLIFAPGLLVGYSLSSCDRISVGTKSPLTGGIKESNAGGRTGFQLMQLGIRALIIEGKPDEEGWWLLHVDAQGAKFVEADEFAGKGVYETTDTLLERYGRKVAIALIGQGGEMQLSSAGIQHLDKDGVPSRISARGGVGAVMGSKGLKAIIFDGATGEKPPVADPKAFQAARKKYTQAVLNHPQSKVYHDYGTAAMTMMCQSLGSLPTRNFSNGQFEKAEFISGEYMRKIQLERDDECEVSHACMSGCVIQSSNVYGGPDGKVIVSPLEYETIGLMGSNLGIGDLDVIARMNREVNDLGLDSIEIGAALGVAAEAGLMDWGDGDRAMALIEEIRAGSPLGRILGSGASVTGKVFNIERVPAVKNQAMSAYDPRAIKGTGVTYATSPQGADHTCGLTIRAKVDHLDPKGKVDLSRGSQISMAGYDSLGACIFAGFGFSLVPEVISEFLNSRYGWDVEPSILKVLGKESLKLERAFNLRAGFTAADDRLPEWMTREPLPPHDAVFDVSGSELDMLFDW